MNSMDRELLHSAWSVATVERVSNPADVRGVVREGRQSREMLAALRDLVREVFWEEAPRRPNQSAYDALYDIRALAEKHQEEIRDERENVY